MSKRAANTRLIGPRSRPGGRAGLILMRMNGITAIPGAAQIATGAIHRSIDNLRKDANIVARSTDVTSRETLGALVGREIHALSIEALTPDELAGKSR